MRYEQLLISGATLLRPLARCVLATAVAALLLGVRAEAQSTYTWTKTSGTNSWNSTANWSPSTGFPNAVGDVANLNNISPTGAVTINLNQTITVGQLLIGDNSSGGGYLPYTIAAGTAGSLVFDATSGNAILSKPTAANTANGDTISANVTLNDNLNITNAAIGNLTISGNITDDSNSRSITKLGSGLVVLSGTNSYGGGTTVSAGTLQFNSAAAIAGTGRDVTVSPGATVATGYAINNAFLNRVAESDDAFTVALGANSSSNLDFGSSAGATLGNARLGAIGAFTYSGTLTPNGNTYRLGGGGGTLTVSSALNDSSGATSVLVDYSGGTVILSGANGYTGGSTVTAGTLRFNSAGAIGGSGRDVTVNAGGVMALGFSSVQATLTNRIVNTSAGAVALTANSSEALDFSSAGANLTAASLGASGTVAYSGTLTPNGTTYRLGGGGGTLTVSSALTDSSGSEARSLVVDASSGGGTVILSNGGNTFTGPTTVSNGTLQLNSAGAFNNIARTVNLNSGGTLTFNAADAAKAAAVTVSSGGLATFSAANAANGGTFTINSGGTANVTAANAANGGTFTVNSGGVLGTAPDSIESAYTGSIIYLDGGTLRYATQGDSTARVRNVGGTVVVRANSTYNAYSIGNGSPPVPLATAIFGALDFNADGYTLTVSNAGTATSKPATITSRFVGSTFSHSGTLNVNAARALVELNNTAIRAGKTLTKTGGQLFTVSGSLGVALLGGAELLGADSFTMITAANTFTNTSTFDTTNGLWSVSGGTSPVTATLAAPLGSIANGQSVAFTASDAASVSLTGLTNGNAYPLTISLENAANQATVMSQLAKNPAFSNIAASGSSQIAMLFTAPAETTRFAWDNVHNSSGDWYLGGNLTAVAAAFSVADPAAVLDVSEPLSGSSDWYFSGAGSTVVSGGFNGSGGVFKTGAGALTLSGPGHTGNFTISEGQLNINAANALGNAASLSLAAGVTLGNTSAAAVTVNNANLATTLGSSLTFLGTQDLSLGTGTVTLGATSAIDVQAGTLTFGGNVVDGGSGYGITKSGTGTLVLSGLTSGAFSGNSVLNAGELFLDGTSTLGGTSATTITVNPGSTLRIGGTASTGGVTVNNAGGTVIVQSLQPSGQTFSANTSLTADDALFNGVQKIDAGVVVSSAADWLGSIPAAATQGRIVMENGAVLRSTNAISINADKGIELAGASATFDADTGSIFINSQVTGTGKLVKTGTGGFRILNQANSYAGGTEILEGTFGIYGDGSLGAAGTQVLIDGATLNSGQDTSGQTITVSSARSIVLGNGKTSNLDATNGSTLAYAGVITEVDGGGAAATLRIGTNPNRTGTVLLGGANTYRGDTIINAGSLKLASGGSFDSSPRIIVGDATGSAGATLDLTEKTAFSIDSTQTLMGKGRVLLGAGTELTVAGLFSPGNSPELFTYDGGGTAKLAGTTLMEITGTTRGTTYDAVDVLGGTVLDFGDGILQLDFDQTFADGTVFNLFTPSGGASLADTFFEISMVGIAYGDLDFTQVGTSGIWNTNVGDDNQSMTFDSGAGTLSISVVPEPAVLGLLASAAAAAWGVWKRRQTRRGIADHGNA